MRARGKGGDHLCEGDERKSPRGPTRTIMGPPHQSSPHPWSASRRSRCPDRLGGSTNNREADKSRLARGSQDSVPPQVGGVVPGNKASGSDPLATNAAGVARTVEARSRVARDTSRSTVESSADEVGFTTVTGGGRGRARRKNRKPAAQTLPTVQAPTEGARSGGRVPPSLPSSTLRIGVSARGATAGSDGSGIRIRTFAEVTGRPPVRPRTGRESVRGAGGGDGTGTVAKGKERTAGGRDTREDNVPGLPRPPRCAAVSLTVRDGSGFMYREAMSIVKREIKLSELDIKELRLRKAVRGGMLFEISGQGAGSKASRLAKRMAATLKELPAKVTVPHRTAELRMTGFRNDRNGGLGHLGGGGGRRCRGRGLPRRRGQSGTHTLHSSEPRVGVATLPADSGQKNQQRRGHPIGR